MSTFTIHCSDGRTPTVEADDIAVTDSGALLAIRANAVAPVLALNARQWVVAYPVDAPVVWGEPAETAQPAQRRTPLAI